LIFNILTCLILQIVTNKLLDNPIYKTIPNLALLTVTVLFKGIYIFSIIFSISKACFKHGLTNPIDIKQPTENEACENRP